MHRRPCRSQNLLIYTTVLPKVLTNLSVYSRPSQLYCFPVRMPIVYRTQSHPCGS
jgi:hypothetical protein